MTDLHEQLAGLRLRQAQGLHHAVPFGGADLARARARSTAAGTSTSARALGGLQVEVQVEDNVLDDMQPGDLREY